MDPIALPTPAPLVAARATLAAAETALQAARNERAAAHAAHIAATTAALADVDQNDDDVQAAVAPAQQRLAAAEEAIGAAEDDAAHATAEVTLQEAAWLAATEAAAAAQLAATQQLAAAQLAAAQAATQLAAAEAAALLATPPAQPAPAAPLGTPAAFVAGATAPDNATLLYQSQLQNQQMMQLLQTYMAAPATTALITAVLYNINNPPINGKDPAAVRHNSSLEFSGPSTAVPVSAFLNNMKAFCKLHKTSAPALLASGYLIKGAAAWFHATYGEQDMYKVFWKDFSSAMLHSYMVDSTADQRLLDKCKTLSQGTLSIKDYLDKSNDIFQNRKTHPFLKDYNEHFFTEMFRSGLHRDTQSRLPAITIDTSYETYTTTALRIAAPLEALAGPAMPLKKPWGRFNRGAGAEKTSPAPRTVPFGAVTPMPPAGQDELSRAAWELANLTPEQRRQARMLRGACTYCGISTHLRDSCPELAKKTAGVNGVAAASPGLLANPTPAELAAVTFTIDSGNGNGATQY
jgi:hypothetical protein